MKDIFKYIIIIGLICCAIYLIFWAGTMYGVSCHQMYLELNQNETLIEFIEEICL